jgi:nucleoside-diphosphate-sugar epimerase
MKILVIGGTRFIGKAVAHLATKAGHEVVLFNRNQTDANAPHPTVTGDIDRITEHKATLRELRPDVVVHSIAYTEQHALNLVDIFAGTTARLIVLSSQDCYEAFYQLNRGRDVAELPLAEDSPTCLIRHYWQDMPGVKSYSDYDKNLVTEVLLRAHEMRQIQASVLRLPMVFGPGDFQFQHRHGRFIRRIFDKQRSLLMGTNEQSSLFTFGYIDNIAAAILRAVEMPVVDGKVFNLGESKSRSLRRWAELYGLAASIPFEFSILPDALIQQDETVLNNPPRLLLFDSLAFRQATGFSEPIPIDDQIRQTLAWGLNNPAALGPQPDYAKETLLIERFRASIRRP